MKLNEKYSAELLSPAGSFEGLRAAVNAGADAVYVGGNMFGARAFAKNFDNNELCEAIDYVHLHGRKLYLTVNTLLKNEEISEKLYNFLEPLYLRGLDAVIVQDFGALEFIKQNFPDMHIHASTQMTITSKYGAKFLEEIGVTRLVTPRELSLGEIREIKAETKIQIESFVHGALCYCYSGQCLFSSILGGRSGNRGRCAQPCRLPYDIISNGRTIAKKKYPLSPKDICTLEILPDIIEAGVYSLKIEGRMKKTEYTAGVTSVYRKYLDLLNEKGKEAYFVDPIDIEFLNKLYSRNEFSRSYYENENKDKKILKNMISYESSNYLSGEDNTMKDIKEEYLKKQNYKKIKGNVIISKEFNSIITISDNENQVSVEGPCASEAQKKPLTKEIVEKQMRKTGNTAFIFEALDIEIGENSFLTVKELNEFRRSALEEFENEILKKYRRAKIEKSYPEIKDIKKSISGECFALTCLVSNKEQLLAVSGFEKIKRIYIEVSLLKNENSLEENIKLLKQKGKEIFIALPHIFRRKTKKVINNTVLKAIEMNIDGFLLRNIDEFYYIKEISQKKYKMVFDHNVYSFNNQSAEVLRSLSNDNGYDIQLTAPLELNRHEMKRNNINDDEVIVYGYIPLMVSEGCVVNTSGRCNKEEIDIFIKDRYGKSFMVKNDCDLCLNTIYNCIPLILADEVKQMPSKGYGYFRLNFSIESAEETKKIINMFINRDNIHIKSEDFTKGHYKRGVD